MQYAKDTRQITGLRAPSYYRMSVGHLRRGVSQYASIDNRSVLVGVFLQECLSDPGVKLPTQRVRHFYSNAKRGHICQL